MSEHPQPQTAVPAKDPSILARIALPLLLFTGILCALLLLSYALLLPRFTRVDVMGKRLSPREVIEHRNQLTASLHALEEDRSTLILPFIDPLFDALKSLRGATPSLTVIHRELADAAARTGEASGTILLSSLSFDVETREVRVSGDVRHVGPRSMTLLASFIEQVESLPMVTALVRPAFAREEDPQIGFHSPFTFTFSVVP